MNTIWLIAAEATIVEALSRASLATTAYLNEHGDNDACGFAWVNVYGVRSNSKLGKLLARYGFSKAYGGGLQLWNPSKSYTQSISAKEVGAQAFADCLKTLGIEVYAGSRLD